MNNPTKSLNLTTGIGFVISNMIGAGVLISAGFMVQNMSGKDIFLAWLLGLFFALCGVKSYATLSLLTTRSGGEYRYLTDLYHPILGNMAGWGSLIMGFSAPVAINAIAFGWFAQTIGVKLSPLVTGTLLVVFLSLFHGFKLNVSKHFQNSLVFLKILLVFALIGIGVFKGSNWEVMVPFTEPNGSDFLWKDIFKNQFWIIFAFSGWNAVIYVSREFREPRKEVPRSMFIGCLVVGILYLLINCIFVSNLSPESSRVVFEYGNESYITLAHVLVEQMMGKGASYWVSVGTMIILASSMSAMIYVGPRVYSEMAEDGALPGMMRMSHDRPPLFSILLQGVVAILFLHTHQLLEVVKGSSILLMFFTCLTVLGTWVLYFKKLKISKLERVASFIYVSLVLWIFYHGVSIAEDKKLLAVFAIIVLLSLISYKFGDRRLKVSDAIAEGEAKNETN
jgi:APA family basic amino acid/polyamine antiporter